VAKDAEMVELLKESLPAEMREELMRDEG